MAYESPAIVARARRKSIAFSRRRLARTRDNPRSFSSSARTAAGVRPIRSAYRATSRSTSSSVASSCSRRATSSITSAAPTASRRGLALTLPERAPVDARLVRVDLLVEQPVRELLDAPIELAFDQRGRQLERHPRRERLHQLRAHVPVRGVSRFVRQIVAHPRAQRVERLELAEILRELVVELGEVAALEPLDGHRIARRRSPPAR